MMYVPAVCMQKHPKKYSAPLCNKAPTIISGYNVDKEPCVEAVHGHLFLDTPVYIVRRLLFELIAR